MRTINKLFRAPYAVPNGLQFTDDGLWIVDQISDRVALVEMTGPGDYGVTKLIREVPSDSSNSSGLTCQNGTLWIAANGSADLWRPPRSHDAKPHAGEILKVDGQTGETLARYPLPGSGGTHGIEFDHFEEDILWLTTLKSQTLSKVRISDWTVLHTVSLPYHRGHGVVRVADGIWVVHTADRVIVKLDVESGRELDLVVVPDSEPEPHGLSIYGDNLIYCDATSGWIVEVQL